MKKFNKKSLVLLACVALLLTFTVSGTVAYLVAGPSSVTNTFTPSKVEITVDDTVESGTKKDVKINNNSSIPVYIRVAIVGNWVTEDGKIVGGWNDYKGIKLNTGWFYNSNDGYYYYTQAVEPTTKSVTMFDSYTPTNVPEGTHLEMTIIAQAIQTEPASALTDANWGWTPTTGTN